MLSNLPEQPVKKSLVFGGATLAVKKLTEVPVCGMNNAHGVSCLKAGGQYNGFGHKGKKTFLPVRGWFLSLAYRPGFS